MAQRSKEGERGDPTMDEGQIDLAETVKMTASELDGANGSPTTEHALKSWSEAVKSEDSEPKPSRECLDYVDTKQIQHHMAKRSNEGKRGDPTMDESQFCLMEIVETRVRGHDFETDGDENQIDLMEIVNTTADAMEDEENSLWVNHDATHGLAPPPPVLERGVMNEAQPGAFSSGPGSSLRRLDSIPITQVGLTLQLNNVRLAESTFPSRLHMVQESGGSPSNQDLAEATAVEDDIVHDIAVDPVDMEELQRKKKDALRQQRQLLILSMLALGSMVVTVVLKMFLGQRNDGKQTVSNSPSSPSSLTPSGAPSPAPSDVLDSLWGSFPNHTLESLTDPFSPQSQAHYWLSNHRNITNLPDWRRLQLFALATFYYSLAGPSWPIQLQRSWLDDTVEECNWFSNNLGTFSEEGAFFEGEKVYPLWGDNTSWVFFYANPYATESDDFCDNVTGEVIDITLESLGLANKQSIIPPEIALLTSLKRVLLDFNEFSGRLEDFFPPEFYQMSFLRSVSIVYNTLSGSIPTEFGLLTSLRDLNFGGNMFTGPIPSELGLLIQLSSMEGFTNHFSGTLPGTLSKLSNLTYLDFGDNYLTGKLSTILGNLSALTLFSAHTNAFTGTIPPQLGTRLSDLALDMNYLTGTLPTELGSLTSMENLWLANNAFTGTIPSQLGILSLLHTLKLQNNTIFGKIPSSMGLLKALYRLDISNLFLSGTIPVGLASNTHLFELSVNGTNNLSGTVPAALCSLQETNCSRYFPYLADYFECFLQFDCSEVFCGCDCDCNDGTSP